MSRDDAAADRELVEQVLATMPVVDGHNDLPTALRATAGYAVDGLDRVRPELHTDLPRLRAGGVGAQFFSVYVPCDLPEPAAVVATCEQIDTVYRLAARYPADLAMAHTADDVERVIAGGRIAALLGVEGGHSLAGSTGMLRTYARLGVRYVTLTHRHNTAWADSATDVPGVGGLDDTGRAIVAELNRIGVLVDLSHVAASTQHAALDVSTAPVIFSHSSARAVTEHPRNVADDVLARLADNGGVVQLTFVPAFVSNEVAQWTAALEAEQRRLAVPDDTPAWPRAPRPGEDAATAAAANTAQTVGTPAADVPAAEPRAAQSRAAHSRAVGSPLADWLAAHPRPEATVAQVADHVDHAREVAGVRHIGLGGDYDGTDRQPVGLADVSGYPRLLAELARRHWSAADLTALTGHNVLRVLRQAEQVATEPLWPPAPAR